MSYMSLIETSALPAPFTLDAEDFGALSLSREREIAPNINIFLIPQLSEQCHCRHSTSTLQK
jgi:hypothetical protein